ncbi:autophagy-related 3 protein [Rutstroemia sp. NJR-2017a BBW]|nr:autophagy-related 3 protein [Rutstroemia sp. NJR-2017a BBW]
MSPKSTCIHSWPVPYGTPELLINIHYAQKVSNINRCRSNCRSIQVNILYPASYIALDPKTKIQEDEQENDSDSSSAVDDARDLDLPEEHENQDIMDMSALNHAGRPQSHDRFAFPPAHGHNNQLCQEPPFPFLSLPLELRLKIYGHLLPVRHHKITTQLPHNGYYYPANGVPAHATQSFYPVSPDKPNKLTTYKLLSENSHPNFPQPSICTAILSVSKQVNAEAEQVLYGSCKSVWDFGMSVEAVKWFFTDRSRAARGCVKNLKLARDVSGAGVEGGKGDVVWEEFCSFVGEEMGSLRAVDLTVWGKGEVAPGPIVAGGREVDVNVDGDEVVDKEKLEEKMKQEKQVREWEYIMKLVGNEGLKSAKITWWGFAPGVESFLARSRWFRTGKWWKGLWF